MACFPGEKDQQRAPRAPGPSGLQRASRQGPPAPSVAQSHVGNLPDTSPALAVMEGDCDTSLAFAVMEGDRSRAEESAWGSKSPEEQFKGDIAARAPDLQHPLRLRPDRQAQAPSFVAPSAESPLCALDKAEALAGGGRSGVGAWTGERVRADEFERRLDNDLQQNQLELEPSEPAGHSQASRSSQEGPAVQVSSQDQEDWASAQAADFMRSFQLDGRSDASRASQETAEVQEAFQEAFAEVPPLGAQGGFGVAAARGTLGGRDSASYGAELICRSRPSPYTPAHDARELLFRQQTQVKLPWEVSMFGHMLPKLEDLIRPPSLGRLDALGLSAAAAVVPETSQAKVATFQAKRLLATRFYKSDDQLVSAALKKLRSVVLFSPADSRLGRSLLNLSGQLVPEDELNASFQDAFAAKSPGTLAKRSNDYMRFALWQVASHRSPLLASEQDLYRYVCELRQSAAAPTSADSFLRAFTFVHYTVGPGSAERQQVLSELMSSRVTGVSRQLFLKKAPLKQAPPFSTEVVWRLEKFVCESRDTALVSMAGFFLFALYSSARFADAARVQNPPSVDRADKVFLVESQSLESKGSRSKEQRTTFLPFIALGMGLFDRPWCRAWVAARAAEGLDDPSMPIIPAFHNGRWGSRRMSTSEGQYFLQDILVAAGVSKDLAATYTSHTLKCTCLSWAAKSGLFAIDERRIMGHHCDPSSAMPLTYSRDALTAVLAKLWKVVMSIKQGIFDPDASRAQRLLAATGLRMDVPEVEWNEDEPAENVAQADSEVSDVTDIGALEGPDIPAQIGEDLARGSFPDVDLSQCMVHRLSRVVHLKETQAKLWCGRPISANLVGPVSGREQDQTFCEQCRVAMHR